MVPLTKNFTNEVPSPSPDSLLSKVALAAFAGLLGGFIGAVIVVGITVTLKAMLAVVSRQAPWILVVVPLIGLFLSVLVLYGLGVSQQEEGQGPSRPRWAYKWRAFVPGVARSDLTGDMVAFAGEEERFPWRLAPIRILAIMATVGLGAPMGTEAPAAYLGVAAGAALGDRGCRWRRLLRPAAVGGGAAGVAVLIGFPLVGTAYVLELGRRHDAPLSAERLTAALVGGFLGWLIHVYLGVSLLRIVVPKEPPHSFHQAVVTALVIGTLAGTITSVTGAAIYQAKAWKANPFARLALGAVSLAAVAILLIVIAAPSAAVGPGAGAIDWIEANAQTAAPIVLTVAILRATATIAAAAAGGCGGLFVPFLAVGDLAGRVFAPKLDVPSDLAGAAGAASGISGGYRLPFTAVALALEQGGPFAATVTCLATVTVAAFAGELAGVLWNRILGPTYLEKRPSASCSKAG